MESPCPSGIPLSRKGEFGCRCDRFPNLLEYRSPLGKQPVVRKTQHSQAQSIQNAGAHIIVSHGTAA